MRSGYITLISKIHDDANLLKRISNYTSKLKALNVETILDSDFAKFDIIFLLIASGGTEELFLKLSDKLLKAKKPFFLLLLRACEHTISDLFQP